jgi:hypothetical protein
MGVGGQRLAQGHFTPERETRYTFYWILSGRQGRSERDFSFGTVMNYIYLSYILKAMSRGQVASSFVS